MPKRVAAYEHGNHIRLKPHCLMDAICLNPIIRPQFITATLFSYRCDTVCFNNSSSMLLLSASTATGNVEWVGDILRHFTSSLQWSRNIFVRRNFNIVIYSWFLDPSRWTREIFSFKFLRFYINLHRKKRYLRAISFFFFISFD